MAKINGFGFFEKQKLKHAMKDAGKCLDKALTEAFGQTDKFQSRVDEFFGGSDVRNQHTTHLIMKTINSMKILIDSDTYVVERGENKPGTNAEAQNFQQKSITFGGSSFRKARTSRYQGTVIYEGKMINSLEAAMNYGEAHAKLKVTMFDNYFELPYKIKNAQSQLETFLHELSHTAAGTHDVDAPKCYGYNGVLYCKQNGKAATNAENYGMFLQSYVL